jgi:hypothetical protein
MVNSFAVYLVDLEDQPMRRDRFGPLPRSRRSRLSPQQPGYVIPDDDEGNLCKARVVELTPDGVVKLAVDKRIFAPADEFVDVAW